MFLHIGHSSLSHLMQLVENELSVFSSGYCLTEEGFKIEECGTFLGYLNNSALDEYQLFPAVGNNAIRHLLIQQYALRLADNLISPRSVISPDLQIGKANLIMPGVFIGPNIKIGSGNIILPGAILSHDIVISDACFISPNSVISGFCKIGNEVKIGSGAVVPPNSSVEHKIELKQNEVYNA